MDGKKIGIIYHRRDLRIDDNLALNQVLKECDIIIPIFIFDPIFFNENRNTCDDRIIFLCECIDNLKSNYKKNNIEMSIFQGDTITEIKRICKYFLNKNVESVSIYYNLDTNMSEGFKRDEKIKKELSKYNQIKLIQCVNDAIIRNKIDTRSNWAQYAQDFFNSELYSNYEYLKNNEIQTHKIKLKQITTKNIIDQYNLKKEKEFNQIGGESEAFKRMHDFLLILQNYPKSISKPYNSIFNCSRLSAYFSFGAISLKRVYQETQKTYSTPRNKQFFITRLFWNQHFTQKLEDFKELPTTAINPFLRKINEENKDDELIEKYKSAQTGYPLVDASILSLTKTGWINFRMRAMIASFFCFIIHQPWKIGADFMAYHLMDCDIAINYAQWQMQAGVVGVHPLRIYNVTKQIYDNDEELKFIKKFLPIFENVKEIEYVAEPWKYEKELYKKYDIKLGIDYPKPIVDFDEESKITRLWFKERMVEIRKALNIPEIKRKASLSQKRSNTQKKSGNQKSSSNSKKSTKTTIKKEDKNKSLLEF